MTQTLALNVSATHADNPFPTRPLAFYKALSHGRAPFWMALEWSDDEALKQLICSDKYDLNEQDKITGQTLTMRLIQQGKFELLKDVINGGADISIQDNNGKTALDHAFHMYAHFPQPDERLKQICTYPAEKETYQAIYHFVHQTVKSNKRLSDLRQSAIMALLLLAPKFRHEQIIRKMHKPQTPTSLEIQKIKKQHAYPLASAILNRWDLRLFRAMCRDKSLQNRVAKGTRYEDLLIVAVREKAWDYIQPLVLLAHKSVLSHDKQNQTALDVLHKIYQKDRAYFIKTVSNNSTDAQTLLAKKKELKKMHTILMFMHRQAMTELREHSLSGNIVGKQALKYHQLAQSLLQNERI